MEILKEDDRLWMRIIEVRWGGIEVSGAHGKIRRTHGLGLWKKIMMEWPKFRECTQWKLGRGNKIGFLLDKWLGGGCLKSRFVLTIPRNMVIKEAYWDSNGSRV